MTGKRRKKRKQGRRPIHRRHARRVPRKPARRTPKRRVRRTTAPARHAPPPAAVATPVPASPPADTSVQAAAAAALSIFKLSPPEPELAIHARRCEQVVAALLAEFPELGEVTGAATAPPPAPSAVESKEDPFAVDAAFGADDPGAPPALAPVAAPEGLVIAIAWEDDPAREELARFEDGTILVSRLHPSFLRARDAGDLDGHLGLCLAWALAGYVAPESARHFVGRFLLRWADAG
ncbi:MAG: hypothetical protein AAB152_15720 [Candidatus Coatesbacteria bacterium]